MHDPNSSMKFVTCYAWNTFWLISNGKHLSNYTRHNIQKNTHWIWGLMFNLKRCQTILQMDFYNMLYIFLWAFFVLFIHSKKFLAKMLPVCLNSMLSNVSWGCYFVLAIFLMNTLLVPKYKAVVKYRYVSTIKCRSCVQCNELD